MKIVASRDLIVRNDVRLSVDVFDVDTVALTVSRLGIQANASMSRADAREYATRILDAIKEVSGGQGG